MKNLWKSVKAFISHYFGDESAAINETMKGPYFDPADPTKTIMLPVDYPAVDQSDEPNKYFQPAFVDEDGDRIIAVDYSHNFPPKCGQAPVVKPKYEVLAVHSGLVTPCIPVDACDYYIEGDRVFFPHWMNGEKARIEYTVNGAYTSKTVRLKRRNGSPRT